MNNILILEGARTPFTTWAGGINGTGVKLGALKPLDPFDLGAAALKEAVSRSGVPADKIDRVVFGIMYAVGANACYGARYVSLRAGLPIEVPGLTVGMACGTGLYAVLSSAETIGAGISQIIATGGSDNVSLVRRDVFVPSFRDLACNEHIAKTAQAMAKEFGVSRADQDRWSLRSHQRALAAQKAGYWSEEIAPVPGASADDNILQNPTPEHFAQAKPLFEDDPCATSANTHGIVDGGAALVLASENGAKAAKAAPLGRYVAGAVVGLEPRRMAYASVVAINSALKNAGLSLRDIDLFEINETFAAQMLIDMKELAIPEEKVNVNGGAIALGHPFGGTGPRLVLTLLKELRRRGLKRGVASICVGGGSGVAVVVERV